MQAASELSSDHLVHLISKTFINLGKQERYFQRCVFLEQNRKQNKSQFCCNIHVKNIMQINLHFICLQSMKFCISEPNLTTVINMEDIFRGMERGTQFIFCPGLPQILVSYCNVYSLYQFIFCPGLPQILVFYCNVYSLFQFYLLVTVAFVDK